MDPGAAIPLGRARDAERPWHPTEVALTRNDGMPDDCVLSFDNLTTVPKTLLTTRIASVPEASLPEPGDALRVATGC